MENYWKCSSNAALCQDPKECLQCSLNRDCNFCRHRGEDICSSCGNLVGRGAGHGAGKEAGEEQYLTEHGKYVLRFAQTHGISIAEAHGHPMVKAHRAALRQLNECRAFAAGEMFVPGA